MYLAYSAENLNQLLKILLTTSTPTAISFFPLVKTEMNEHLNGLIIHLPVLIQASKLLCSFTPYLQLQKRALLSAA